MMDSNKNTMKGKKTVQIHLKMILLDTKLKFKIYALYNM